MNRVHKTLWSESAQCWQAVPETAKAAGKRSVKSASGGVLAMVLMGLVLTGGAGAQSPPAITQLPSGGTVVRGSATISQTATAQAAAMTVNQSSQRAVINWDSFNLGSAASINYVQPNAQAVTLNRVNDHNPSQIFGRITSNGQVFLSNPSGVYFSPTASVDVGALVATSHSISDANFMAGNYQFERNGATGKVVNEGRINAALGGYVALLAPEVQNAGVVLARAGTVALAAGEVISLQVQGGGLAGITTTPSTIATLIDNQLAVQAPDGQIILSAVALNKLQAGVIKNSGSLEANSLVAKGGKIYLEAEGITLAATSRIEAKGPTGGGTVLVGGDWQGSGEMRQAVQVTMDAGATIEANATQAGDGGQVVLYSDISNPNSQTVVRGSISAQGGPLGGNGGSVETSGQNLQVGSSAIISTLAPQGQSGNWLLDPYDVTISSAAATNSSGNTASGSPSVINATALQTALRSGSVTVSTGSSGTEAGNITVASDLAWDMNTVLTLSAAGGITGSGNIAMTNGTAPGVVFDQAGNSTYSGVISGDYAGVTKSGAGSLALSGLNTYLGVTTINSGTLQISGSGSLRNGVYNQNMSIASGANFFYSSSAAQTLSGRISGDGALTKDTSSTSVLTLSNANTYTGTTTVSAGTLAVTSSTGLGTTAGGTTVASGATLDLQGAAFGAEAIALSGTLTSSTTGTASLSGVISGTGAVTKTGAGTLTLSGANTYSGGTTVNAGTLIAGVNTSGSITNGPVGTGMLTANGGTFDLNGKTVANAMSLSGGGSNGALVNSSGTAATASGAVTLAAATSLGGTGDVNLSGVISGASSGLALLGTGSWTLSNASNTLSTIASGTSIGALNVLNSTALTIGQVTVGGTLYSGISSTGTVAVTTNSGDLTVSQNVATSSTSTSTSAPALKLSAGASTAAGTATGGNVVLSGSPTISVGAGGIAAFYSGNFTSGAGLDAVVTAQPANYSLYNSGTSTLPTSGAGYYGIYRATGSTSIYLIATSGQSSVYGTAPSLTYQYSSSASGIVSTAITGIPSGVQTFSLTGGAVSYTVNVAGGAQGSLALTGSPSIASAGLVSTTNAGIYALTLTPSLTLAGYTFLAGTSPVNYTISKAALTVTANNASKTYGDANPTLSTTVSGFVNGETLGTSGVAGTGAATTTATTATGAGTVTITAGVGSLTASNYDFSNWVNGTLTVQAGKVSDSEAVLVVKKVVEEVAQLATPVINIPVVSVTTTPPSVLTVPVPPGPAPDISIAPQTLAVSELPTPQPPLVDALPVPPTAPAPVVAALLPGNPSSNTDNPEDKDRPTTSAALRPTATPSLQGEQVAYLRPAEVSAPAASLATTVRAEPLAPAASAPTLASALPQPNASAAPVAAAAPASVQAASASTEAPRPAPTVANVNAPAAAPTGTGVLAITILRSNNAQPSTVGVAFEQNADTVSLRATDAPLLPPSSERLAFSDRLTTFLVANSAGTMVEFQGSLVNNRMVIVAPSNAARLVAQTDMNTVLAAAVTSLGRESRVMLAQLDGVVLDLR